MAFVALQFEENQIFVASAKINGKRIQVQDLFSVPLEGNDADAGELLKARLTQHNLTRSDAILVIGRGDAEIREISVPPAPNNELPDMVRFIARSEFASLNDSWALDYVPMSEDESLQRTVLAVGISPELQTQLDQFIEPSGLRVRHIVLRPYATVDLIRSKLADEQCRLIVDPNGDTTDMTIVDGVKLVATRSVRIPDSYDSNQRSDALLSEVRRTLASSRKTLGDKKVSEVVLFGDPKSNKPFEGNLKSHLDLAVDFIDPIKLTSASSSLQEKTAGERFAALLGSLVQQASSTPHAIDFVNPRRPIVKKRDFTKWYIYSGVALAAVLLAMIGSWWVLSGQASENELLQNKLTALRNKNDGRGEKESVKQILGEIAMIDNWKKSDVNWLDEIYQYSERALTPDDSIVDLFDATASTKADMPPRVAVKTRLANVEKESELVQSLSERPYLVDPRRGGYDESDEEYPVSSTFNISLDRNDTARLKEIDERAGEYLKERNQRLLENSKPVATPAEKSAEKSAGSVSK